MRSYCDDQYVSELAVTAGYYQAKAEIMQRAIKRIVSEPDNYANRVALERLAKDDMDSELAATMVRHGINVEENQDA